MSATDRPSLAAAFVAALDDDALDELAALLAPRLAGRLTAEADGRGYMAPAAAARYLGRTTRRVHDLKSAGLLVPDAWDGRVPLYTRQTLDAYARRTQ